MDREFKTAVMEKLNKMQENTGRQFNELTNKINEQKGYFTKEIEILKKNQTNSGADGHNKRDKECIKKHWKYSRLYGKSN